MQYDLKKEIRQVEVFDFYAAFYRSPRKHVRQRTKTRGNVRRRFDWFLKAHRWRLNQQLFGEFLCVKSLKSIFLLSPLLPPHPLPRCVLD
jgi:hypothetical protein